MPSPKRDPDGGDDDEEQEDAPATPLPPLSPEDEEMFYTVARALAREEMKGVSAFDQLLAHLKELVHTMGDVACAELPQGQRIELVRVASKLLSSAILGLQGEWDRVPPPTDDPYGQALAIISDLDESTRERRLATRVRVLSGDIAPPVGWEPYHEIAEEGRFLDELAFAEGLEPSDETIASWLHREVARRRTS